MSEAFEVVCSAEDRERWLKERLSGIGSSDAPAVLGVSRWASPVSVYAEKVGAQEPKEEDERMEWGRILEPLVRQRFQRETGRRVSGGQTLLRSRRWPFLLATLDAEQLRACESSVVGEPGVLEIKTSNRRDWDDGVPQDVFVQVQHQLAVTGYEWASVAVLIAGQRFYWADLERDESFIEETLVPTEREFWQRVRDGEPPPTDASEATRKALARIYPEDDGSTIELPGELIQVDADLQGVKADIAALEATKRDYEAKIKAAIGDASIGVLPGGIRYSFKEQRRKETTVAASSFRVLRRSGPRE